MESELAEHNCSVGDISMKFGTNTLKNMLSCKRVLDHVKIQDGSQLIKSPNSINVKVLQIPRMDGKIHIAEISTRKFYHRS